MKRRLFWKLLIRLEVFLYPISILLGIVLLCCMVNVNLTRVSIYMLGLVPPDASVDQPS